MPISILAMSILYLSRQVLVRVALAGDDSNCCLLVRGAHNGSSKWRGEVGALRSLPVPLLRLLPCGWVDGSMGSAAQWPISRLTCYPLFRCLPSPQAAWTGDQQKCFSSPFILDQLKPSLLLPGCLYCFFITKSLSVQCQRIGPANLFCSWRSLTRGAWSSRSSGLVSAVKVRWMWNLNLHEYHYAPEFSQILHAGTFSDPLQGYSSWKIK